MSVFWFLLFTLVCAFRVKLQDDHFDLILNMLSQEESEAKKETENEEQVNK